MLNGRFVAQQGNMWQYGRSGRQSVAACMWETDDLLLMLPLKMLGRRALLTQAGYPMVWPTFKDSKANDIVVTKLPLPTDARALAHHRQAISTAFAGNAAVDRFYSESIEALASAILGCVFPEEGETDAKGQALDAATATRCVCPVCNKDMGLVPYTVEELPRCACRAIGVRAIMATFQTSRVVNCGDWTRISPDPACGLMNPSQYSRVPMALRRLSAYHRSRGKRSVAVEAGKELACTS